MNASGKNRVKQRRAELVGYWRAGARSSRRLVFDISGLSHQQCAHIMFGNFLQQLGALFRFVLFQSICMLPIYRMKNAIYRMFGMRIGKNVYIAPGVFIDSMHPRLIQIDDNVIVGMGAAIVTHERTMEVMAFGRVHIQENCCIGGGSVIRCGVTVGKGAAVDMLQGVAEDVPDGAVFRGGQVERTPSGTKGLK